MTTVDPLARARPDAMNHASTWARASDWALARFTRPTMLAKPQGLTLIAAMLVGIGLADYASGIRVSLVVFYIVPILLSVTWFGWETAIGVVCGSVLVRITGDYIANGDRMLPFWSWWNTASSLVVFLFIVWVFSNLLTLYRQLEGRVAERTAELLRATEHRRLLEHELLEVTAHERNRMGQELHDDICQHLVGTSLAARVLVQRLANENSAWVPEAEAIIGLIEDGTRKTRRLARGLLLSEIEPGQLTDKLKELADEGSRSGVRCRFRQAGDVLVRDAGAAAQLYRIAQEAMRNAIRHADASQVEISLVGDDTAICLVVQDDGHGVSEAEPSSGMGLPIMMHRAAYIGATLSLVPKGDHGTEVVCHLFREPSIA